MLTHFSPLEQFEMFTIMPIFKSKIFYFAFTNSTLFLMLMLSLFLTMMHFIKLNTKMMPTSWQSIIEELYLMTKDMVEKTIGGGGTAFFPFIFFLFSFMILSNLVGTVPYSFTITSHFFVTFGMSLTLFVGINMMAVKIHKLKVLGFFVPSGIPLVMAPFFVALEMVSYIARVFSLAIRLFANLLAGHTLLKLMAGFVWTMLSFGGVWLMVQLLPLFLMIAITALELGIALIQAYVFTMLTCIYLHDAIELH